MHFYLAIFGSCIFNQPHNCTCRSKSEIRYMKWLRYPLECNKDEQSAKNENSEDKLTLNTPVTVGTLTVALVDVRVSLGRGNVNITPALVPTQSRSRQASSAVTRRQAILCCRMMSSATGNKYNSVRNKTWNSVPISLTKLASLSLSHLSKLIIKLISLCKPSNSNTPPAASASEATAVWLFTNIIIFIYSPKNSITIKQ